jgi:hypothetical protein
MPLFDKTDDSWQNTRNHNRFYHRNDYFTELVREATGLGGSNGANGDVIPARANYQTSSTVSQVKHVVDGTNNSANRINGVSISNVIPTNGQVLTFVTGQNQFVPMTPVSTSKAFIGGAGALSTPSIGPAYIAMDDSIFSTTESDTQIIVPFNGTLRNLHMFIKTESQGKTYTVRVNGVDTAIVITSGGSGPPASYQDITNTAAVLAGDKIDIAVPAVAIPNAIITSISIELDAT